MEPGLRAPVFYSIDSTRQFLHNENVSHSQISTDQSLRYLPGLRRQCQQRCLAYTVLERYYRELLNFCARMVRDPHAAADVVQESYARVLAVRNSGQAMPEPRALLYQTARRLIIDRHRRQAVREHDDIDALADDAQAAAPSHLEPESLYAHEQHARAIVATIEALPPRCREAFVLNRFEGLSHQEVADHMGISKNMVAQHIIRAVLACKACEDALNGAPLPGKQEK